MKTIWVVVITVVITGVLVGGGTYYFLNKQATDDKNALQAQITELGAQVAAAEQSLADLQSVAQ